MKEKSEGRGNVDIKRANITHVNDVEAKDPSTAELILGGLLRDNAGQSSASRNRKDGGGDDG